MAAPVKHTCPDIDKALKILYSAIKDAEYAIKSTEKGTDQYDWFREILSQIEDVPAMLEELRSANESLRSWGEELTNEIESSANYIDELEQKIEKHENTLQHT